MGESNKLKLFYISQAHRDAHEKKNNSQVYWVGPMVGAALGTSAYQVLFSPKEARNGVVEATSEERDYESYKMTELQVNTAGPENLAIE